MKRLLVTGASGFLGWNICEFPQDDWEIIGLYHDHAEGVPEHIDAYQLDISNPRNIEELIERKQIDAVLHLAAYSSPKFCEENPDTSYQLNVIASRHIAQICKDFAIHLVFASSEQVYDGNKTINTEEDELNPINAYGRQKMIAEDKMLKVNSNIGIARLAVMFGEHGSSAKCFMTEWMDTWAKNETVTAFHDEIRCFLSGYSAAEGLFLMLNQKVTGIYNIGGADAISRLDFANKLAEKFDFKDAQIKSASQKDIPGLAETRPSNLTLDLGKMENLGFTLRSIAEELEELS